MVLHTTFGLVIGCIGGSIVCEMLKDNPRFKKWGRSSKCYIFIGGVIGGTFGLGYDCCMLGDDLGELFSSNEILEWIKDVGIDIHEDM